MWPMSWFRMSWHWLQTAYWSFFHRRGQLYTRGCHYLSTPIVLLKLALLEFVCDYNAMLFDLDPKTYSFYQFYSQHAATHTLIKEKHVLPIWSTNPSLVLDPFILGAIRGGTEMYWVYSGQTFTMCLSFAGTCSSSRCSESFPHAQNPKTLKILPESGKTGEHTTYWYDYMCEHDNWSFSHGTHLDV